MPQARKHLAIIIPVYNEESVIRRVITSLPKKLEGVGETTIVAVNDGSTDNSLEEIEKTSAVSVNLPLNLGYGGASVTGLEAAKELEVDLAITFDGDGQHCSKDIQKMIKPILENRADLVLGNRFKNSNTVPFEKRFGIKIMNLITFLLSGYWSGDSQCGLKAFSKKAIQSLNLNLVGMEFSSEIIMEAKRKHLKIAEVPVEIVYTDYSKKKGQSITNGINILIKLIIKAIAG
jgi:glycosyltransferase involved in cell wall biosynthesis